MSEQQTICALSSGTGRAGVAVLRVSGSAAGGALEGLAGEKPAPRVAALRRLRHPWTGDVLDEGLVIWFPAPHSFTGEDTCELHLHGGKAVVASVLSVLCTHLSCRLAEPGEFARRAFENGKLDLTAAEGLADLIDAETEAQRRQAVRQAGGALHVLYEGWRAQLIAALAFVEASIDFSDEGDVAADAQSRAGAQVRELQTGIARHLDDGNRGEILREGFHVVLAGPPNVGKSSLLNSLARRDAAITSDEAGTTRDVIEVRLDLDGFPVIVSDTAGIRASQGAVEREGIRRTLERGRAADLIVWMMDARVPDAALPPEFADRNAQTLWVLNKIDLVDLPPSTVKDSVKGEVLGISALTGQGISELARRITALAADRVGASEEPVITQARHRQALEDCLVSLDDFLRQDNKGAELLAEDLRRAAHALGRITGRVDAELVLGQIFSRFCIGK